MLGIPAIPGPNDVVGAAGSALARAGRAATVAAGIPGRVVAALDRSEELLTRAGDALAQLEDIADRASLMLRRVDGVLDETARSVARTRSVLDAAAQSVVHTEALLAEAGRVTALTGDLITTAAGITATSERLVAQLDPAVTKLAPLAQRFADELSAVEVDSAIALVDELPGLTRSLQQDIVPILATLDRVGPEISELLEVTHDVRRAIVGIPGFGFFKKRGADLLEEEGDAVELEQRAERE